MPKATVNGLAVTYQPAANLKPHSQNARVHSPRQIAHLVKSMRIYGWTNPILIDGVRERGCVEVFHLAAPRRCTTSRTDNRQSGI